MSENTLSPQNLPSHKNSKFDAGKTIIGLFLILILLIPGVSFAKEDITLEKEAPQSTYDKLKVFSEILALLEANYVEPVESNDLVEGAIRGLLKTLDPHTTYMAPDSYKQMQVETSGKFGGLGIEITVRNGILTVVAPIEGTPADKAGMQANDKIIKIEDESTLDLTLTEAVNMLRGERGTTANITVIREGVERPFEVSITRDVIKVKSAKFKIYNNDVGYVRLRSFTKNTSIDLDAALDNFEKNHVSKLVLDLRNNPGACSIRPWK